MTTDRHAGKPALYVPHVLRQIDKLLTEQAIDDVHTTNELLYLDMLNVARRTIVRLSEDVEAAQLASIQASNPGIDMEQVKESRFKRRRTASS